MSNRMNNVAVSKLAIASLVLGILTLLVFWAPIFHLLPGFIAVVLGLVSLRIVRSGTASGGGMALAGIVCGLLGMVPTGLFAIAAIGLYLSPPEIEIVQMGPSEQDEFFKEFHQDFAQQRLESRQKQAPSYVLHALEAPRNHGGYRGFDITPDGKLIAGGTGTVSMSFGNKTDTAGGEVILWDAESGKIATTLGDHKGSTVMMVKFGNGGRVLTSISDDNRLVKTWDVRKEKSVSQFELKGDYSLINPPVLAPNGRWLANVPETEMPSGEETVNPKGELTVWDIKTGTAAWSLPVSTIHRKCFTTDSATLIYFAGKMLTALDTATGEERWQVEEKGRFTYFLPSPDGKTVWGVGSGPNVENRRRVTGKLKCWNLANGEVVKEQVLDLKGHFNVAKAVFHSDENSIVMIEFMDTKLKVFDVVDGTESASIEIKFPNQFNHAAFSADRKRMVCDFGMHVGPSVIDVEKLLAFAE